VKEFPEKLWAGFCGTIPLLYLGAADYPVRGLTCSVGSISILKRDLTPQPPSLQGKGEKDVNFPLPCKGRGAGGRGQIRFLGKIEMLPFYPGLS